MSTTGMQVPKKAASSATSFLPKIGDTPQRGEGTHVNATLESGELVVPRDLRDRVLAKFPELAHGPTAGRRMDDGGTPPSQMPDISNLPASTTMNQMSAAAPERGTASEVGTKKQKLVNTLEHFGGGGGGGRELNQADDPMLDVSHPQSQLQWQDQPLPSYGGGGVVPKDQVAEVHEGERVLDPQEAHAFRSAAQGEAPPTVLGRIAARTHELLRPEKNITDYPTGTGNPEVTAIHDKGEQIDALKAQGEAQNAPAQMRQYPNVDADRIDPNARYGARMGEKRLYTNPQGDQVNPTTPAGMGAGEPKLPVPTALGKIGMPSYDEGVDRVPEDQVAQVHEGEHVLTPQEAAAYKQAENEVMNEAPLGHGSMQEGSERQRANAPLGGRMDTEGPKPDYNLQAAEMHTENAPLGKPKMNVDNPPSFDEGNIPSEASTEVKKLATGPLPTEMRGPGGKPMVAPEAPVAEPVAPDPMSIVKQDKVKAMLKGPDGLADLGTAQIHERMLKAEQGMPLSEPTAPEGGPVAPDATAVAQGKGFPGAGFPTMPQDATVRPNTVGGAAKVQRKEDQTLAHKEFEDKRADYDKRIQAAMDLGTPEGDREADSLGLAKMHFEKMNPYGSTGNHPGFLGKLEHGLAKVGNIAGDIVAPKTMAMIPGTQLNRNVQANALRNREAAATEEGLKVAQTKNAQAQPELAQAKAALAEEKADIDQQKAENTLRAAGYMHDPTGKVVPLDYAEMSPQARARVDKDESLQTLNESKGHEQEAKAILDKYKADPNNAQNQIALKRVQLEGQKVAIAGGSLGLHQKEFLRDTYGVDEKGNPIPGVQTTPEGKPIGTKVGKGAGGGKVTANQSMKADLAENVVHNVDAATKLIRENPDLFGKVAGRFTTASQMMGSDDKAIAKLGLIIHNTSLATNGIHGLRSAQAIEGTEKALLNKFKNSAEATISALKENRRSVGDFIKDGGKTMPADPDLVPAGATHPVFDKDGKTVIGHVVNNKFVKLPEE